MFDFTPLLQKIERVAREEIPVVMAVALKEEIVKNSAKGEDIMGRKMKDYSPAYKRFLAKHNLPTSPVTLRRSGKMLDNQGVALSSGSATLAPNPNDQPKAQGNQRLRKFYPEEGIHPRTMKVVTEAAERRLTKAFA